MRFLVPLFLFELVGIVGAAPGQKTSPLEAAIASRLKISVSQDRIDATIENYPFRGVLEELSAKTGIPITVADGLDGDSVSLVLKDVPVQRGLRELVANYDSFFLYGSTENQPAVVRAVWIYPKGAGADIQPVPAHVWASVKEIEASLLNADTSVRERAYEALMSRPDRRSQALVLDAITGNRETDDGLRQKVFSAAVAKGLELPSETLSQLALVDSSEQIRWMALDALAQRADVERVARAALTDISDHVREKAKEILADWDAVARRATKQTAVP